MPAKSLVDCSGFQVVPVENLPTRIVLEVLETIEGISEHCVCNSLADRVLWKQIGVDTCRSLEVSLLQLLSNLPVHHKLSAACVDSTVHHLHVGLPLFLVVLVPPCLQSTMVRQIHLRVNTTRRRLLHIRRPLVEVCAHSATRVSVSVVLDACIVLVLLVEEGSFFLEHGLLVLVEDLED